MAAPPVRPVLGVAGPAGPGAEQAGDLRDGQRDHPQVGGRPLTGADRFRCLGTGAVARQGGGHGADRQCGHYQHGVAGDRVIEADLGLVEAEAVLAEFEIFLGASQKAEAVSRFMARHRRPMFCPVAPDPVRDLGIGHLSYACAGAGSPGSACQPRPISRSIGGYTIRCRNGLIAAM